MNTYEFALESENGGRDYRVVDYRESVAGFVSSCPDRDSKPFIQDLRHLALDHIPFHRKVRIKIEVEN